MACALELGVRRRSSADDDQGKPFDTATGIKITMAKLSNLKPRLGSLAPRLGYAAGDEKARDRQRNAGQHWRKWYSSTEWRKLRMRVLIRDLFTCQMCGKLEPNTALLVGDHKEPHRGDRARFFDEQNVWAVCKPCHDGEKQKLERAQGFR